MLMAATMATLPLRTEAAAQPIPGSFSSRSSVTPFWAKPRHTDQFGEASAEGAQRRAADREADLGDAEVATTQQRHRALDAPRHQIGVRLLAVGEPELAAEVPGRDVGVAGERLD